MSQPDMFPEETPRDEPARRALHHKREDLRALPFPLGDWGEPAERLEELYRWAECGAQRTADWYLHHRLRKRRAARTLRATAALSAATGLALPLVRLTGTARPTAGWSCLAMLLAAVCLGMDRAFGLTAGWMRGVCTAQAVERRLEALRFDWASESVREVLGPTEGTAAEAAERCLAILRRFCDDIADLVRAETSDWMLDSAPRAAVSPLRTQSTAWAPARQDTAGPRRFAHPSMRPNMPRQRPGEGAR